MYSNTQFLPSPLSSLGGGETPLGLLIAKREEEEEGSQVKFVGERKEGKLNNGVSGSILNCPRRDYMPKGGGKGGEKLSATSHAWM